MEDLKTEFGKEFVDCIMGKCKTLNCRNVAENDLSVLINKKEQLCQKEKELMVQKSVDLRKK
jgi:hypothetical protein